LADEHAIVLEGLRRVLEPDFEIVGEVADGRALVTAAGLLRPDIIVIDISMPLLNGIEAARQIRKINRKVKIIFLTMHPDVIYAAEALGEGESAYVLKSSAGAELLEAIREALSGVIYVTPYERRWSRPAAGRTFPRISRHASERYYSYLPRERASRKSPPS
jgi:DNA-binding NarL/FixJ family response regulator